MAKRHAKKMKAGAALLRHKRTRPAKRKMRGREDEAARPLPYPIEHHLEL